MLPGSPAYEVRASAPSFPGPPTPADRDFQEEIYLIPVGILGHSIKLLGAALEIEVLLQERARLQLSDPATRFPFSIMAALVECRLLAVPALSETQCREQYDAEALLREILEAQHRNSLTVPVAKQRRPVETTGCQAEMTEVEVAGQRTMTAAVEHEKGFRPPVGHRRVRGPRHHGPPGHAGPRPAPADGELRATVPMIAIWTDPDGKGSRGSVMRRKLPCGGIERCQIAGEAGPDVQPVLDCDLDSLGGIAHRHQPEAARGALEPVCQLAMGVRAQGRIAEVAQTLARVV